MLTRSLPDVINLARNGVHDESDTPIVCEESDPPPQRRSKGNALKSTKKKPTAPAKSVAKETSANAPAPKKKKVSAQHKRAPISKPIVVSDEPIVISSDTDAASMAPVAPVPRPPHKNIANPAQAPNDSTEEDEEPVLNQHGDDQQSDDVPMPPVDDSPASRKNAPFAKPPLVDYPGSDSDAEDDSSRPHTPPLPPQKNRPFRPRPKPKPVRREGPAAESEQEYPPSPPPPIQSRVAKLTNKRAKGKGKAVESTCSSQSGREDEELPSPPPEQEWIDEGTATARAIENSRCKHPFFSVWSGGADSRPPVTVIADDERRHQHGESSLSAGPRWPSAVQYHASSRATPNVKKLAATTHDARASRGESIVEDSDPESARGFLHSRTPKVINLDSDSDGSRRLRARTEDISMPKRLINEGER